MPGPMGECCRDCYWWDVDNAEVTKIKKYNNTGIEVVRYAECCIGAPAYRTEIVSVAENKWCDQYLNRDYGVDLWSTPDTPEEE